MEETFDLKSMVNVPFDLPLGDKTFTVKKASLTLVQQYLDKVDGVSDSATPSQNLDLVAYAVYLVIHQVDATVTEEWVKDNIPGVIAASPMPLLVQLGFLDPQKASLMQKMQEVREGKILGKSSQE